MFDSLVTATTGSSGAAAVDAWARVENAACARRLAAMLTILDRAYAASGSASRDQWCLDNWDAVIAEICASQRTPKGTTEGFLLTALALRDRFPHVAAVFADGLITYSMARLIITRGALITDPDALRTVDAAMAAALRSPNPMSRHEAARTLDALIAEHDPHAEPRTRTKARDRSVEVVVDDASGLAQVFATLFTHDALALEARVDAMAATVCPNDPRTTDQRRADAIIPAMTGATRLPCLCDTPDCTAGDTPPANPGVVYVIAHHDTITPPTPAPTPDEPTVPDGAPELGEDSDVPDDAEGVSTEDHVADATPDNRAKSSRDASSANLDTTHTKLTETPTPKAECTALDGEPPARFTKPLRDLTLHEALTPAPGYFTGIRPAALMGGQLLPGSIAQRAALGATIIPIVHPGHAPPEPHYRPSKKLAAFIRCRDLTCRFPGCHVPATHCDIDHAIPWPYGKTQASNLACLCRRHHLLKTFWGGQNGWREKQLDDGTITWTTPDGQKHTTTPGSQLLFPELCRPTASVKATQVPPAHTSGLTMPQRTTTRAQDRTRRIHTERELNRVEAEGVGASPAAEPKPPL